MTKIAATTLTAFVNAQLKPDAKKNLVVDGFQKTKLPNGHTVQTFTFREASVFESIKMAFSHKKREAENKKMGEALVLLQKQEALFIPTAGAPKNRHVWKDLGVRLLPSHLQLARQEELKAKKDPNEVGTFQVMGFKEWAKLKQFEQAIYQQINHTTAPTGHMTAPDGDIYAVVNKHHDPRPDPVVEVPAGAFVEPIIYATVAHPDNQKTSNQDAIHGDTLNDVIYSTVQHSQPEEPIYQNIIREKYADLDLKEPVDKNVIHGTKDNVIYSTIDPQATKALAEKRNIRDPLPAIPTSEK